MNNNDKFLFLEYLKNNCNFQNFLEDNPHIKIEDINSFLNEMQKKINSKRDNESDKNIVKIFIDGASRGNPGKAGVGFVFLDKENKVILEGYKYLGVKTNNEAEYQALILALETALKKGLKNIEIYSDSELLVKQINRDYKVRNKNLLTKFNKAIDLLNNFEYKISHIPREKNKIADKLANIAIDNMERGG